MIATFGIGSQQIITQGYGDFGTHSDLSVEIIPAQTWPFTEAKPADGYTLEALPTRPGAEDGFYFDGANDGFYDEYPVDGFYAKTGYFREFKPQRRATVTKEVLPS